MEIKQVLFENLWEVGDKRNFFIIIYLDKYNDTYLRMDMTDMHYSPDDDNFSVDSKLIGLGKQNSPMFDFLLKSCHSRQMIRELMK